MKKTIALSLLIPMMFIGAILYTKNIQDSNAKKAQNSSTRPDPILEITPEEPKKETKLEVKTQPVKLLFVGDVMLARSIGQKIESGENPFKFVVDTFSEYDLVIANLETTIGNTGKSASGKLYTFQAPVKAAETLKNSGVGVVSLANNHTMDYGVAGLNQTISNLDSQGIKYFGAGDKQTAFETLVVDVKNQKIGLLGFNEIETNYTAVSAKSSGNAYYDIVEIKKSITGARTQNPNLPIIVMPHWGVEYDLKPSATQKSHATEIFNAGASVIIGGHAHVIQKAEKIGDKQVYYSMGNFVFDQMGSKANATSGQMIEVVIENNQIISTKAIDIYLDSNGFPRVK